MQFAASIKGASLKNISSYVKLCCFELKKKKKYPGIYNLLMFFAISLIKDLIEIFLLIQKFNKTMHKVLYFYVKMTFKNNK